MIFAYLVLNWKYIDYFESIRTDKIVISMRNFQMWCQIKAILKNSKLSELAKFWGPGEHFRQKCHRKLGILFK